MYADKKQSGLLSLQSASLSDVNISQDEDLYLPQILECLIFSPGGISFIRINTKNKTIIQSSGHTPFDLQEYTPVRRHQKSLEYKPLDRFVVARESVVGFSLGAQ